MLAPTVESASPAMIGSPEAHGRALHRVQTGHAALARKDAAGRWHEGVYRVCDLADVLRTVGGERDVYLSIHTFSGWRRIARLSALGALFVDLDYYKVAGLQDAHPISVLEDALVMLESARIPGPSLAVGSGRGLYLLWLHDPVPRSALPRWNACQREIWSVLLPLGADRGALDAARVLRVIGTRNGKADATVETLTPTGEVWNFDALADEVLPLTRDDLRDLRLRRAARGPRVPSEVSRGGFGLTQGTLWAARLDDLQRLRHLRFWDGALPPGQRDFWILLAANAMSWLAPPTVLRRELFALAREAGGWDEHEAETRLDAVLKRAHAAAWGKTIEYAGVPLDPRYRFKNETILEMLQITPAEERKMKTIISRDEGRRRDRERKERERREAGSMPRVAYLEAATKRREEARELHADGLTQRRISERLGISERQVRRLLSEEPDISVPLYGGGTLTSPPKGTPLSSSPQGTARRGATGRP